MMDTAVPVQAIVVATRGGAQLPALLAALDWARERTVLDPAGEVPSGRLPATVGIAPHAGSLAALGRAPWLLLLCEHELPQPGLRDAVARAVAGPPAAFRAVLELETLGARFRLPAPPIRLAPRQGCRVSLDRALEPVLAAAGPFRHLGAGVCAHRGASVGEAFDTLLPESQVLTALLAQLGQRVGARAITAAPLASLLRVLRARAARPPGLARWVAAVFAAYRVVVAQIGVREWRHAQPATLREVG